MANEINPVLLPYIRLVEFLGLALGPDYEVALHDMTNRDHSIIAIANNSVSGREVGAPLTNVALSILRDKSYEWTDYRLQYHGISARGKDLRSNTFYIKHQGKLVGMLCINFDDSRYRSLASDVLRLCHPDAFLAGEPSLHAGLEAASVGRNPAPEKFRNSSYAVVEDAIYRELGPDVQVDRLTHEERLQVVRTLERAGIFLLKGAVKDVADGLHCSQASVYRYLSQVKNEGQEDR